jgi:hypothetical protein
LRGTVSTWLYDIAPEVAKAGCGSAPFFSANEDNGRRSARDLELGAVPPHQATVDERV